MNVLFVHDIEFVGGGELWAMRVGEQLIQAGHGVRYAFPEGSPCHDAAKERGLQSHSVPFYGLFDEMMRRWESVLQDDDIDVVVCSVMGFQAEVQILASAIGTSNKPALILKSGTPPILSNQCYGEGLESQLDGFLTISPRLRALFIERGLRSDLLHFLWEGIDMRRFDRARRHIRNPRMDLRAQLGVDAGIPLLLSAGRVTEAKGLRTQLEGLALLHQRGVDFRCVHFGDGSDDEYALLKDRATLLGLKGMVFFAGRHPEIAPFLLQADVFVHASHSEGVPNVVTEAMAAGLAIVATDVGGTGDVILDGTRGYLCPPKDPSRLADRLERLIVDEDLRSEFGERAQVFARDVLDADVALKALIRYLENAIEGRLRHGPRGSNRQSMDSKPGQPYFGGRLIPVEADVVRGADRRGEGGAV